MDMAGIAHSLWICECKPHSDLCGVQTNKSEYLPKNFVFLRAETDATKNFWRHPFLKKEMELFAFQQPFDQAGAFRTGSVFLRAEETIPFSLISPAATAESTLS